MMLSEAGGVALPTRIRCAMRVSTINLLAVRGDGFGAGGDDAEAAAAAAAGCTGGAPSSAMFTVHRRCTPISQCRVRYGPVGKFRVIFTVVFVIAEVRFSESCWGCGKRRVRDVALRWRQKRTCRWRRGTGTRPR